MIFCVLVGPATAEVSRPFILWTRAEAAAIRQRIETEPWAKAAYEAMLQERGLGSTYRNLFRYVVMGDQKAGEAEKKYLLGIIGTHPRQFEKLEHGGRHFTCHLDVLRYDCVHDLLSEQERASIEATFRDYIAYQLEDKKVYTRTSWLPNMQWPRPMAAHIMAVGLADRELIRQLIHSNGGWKYYFDDYIADGQFYMEEFGKHYSMIGEMLLFCRGLQRLGLNEYGYGYVGRGGATMRRYLESILAVGYPRTDIPGGMPHYGKITMGDAKGGPFPKAPRAFQHAIVPGYLRDATTASVHWIARNMNGRDHRGAKVEKMLTAHWFEIAHAQWPDAGFDYFLAQMRPPQAPQYIPSLFWGLSPIDPAKVRPPPAPSYVAPDRGFAFLRANESPAYWESPDPAVALQFATYYVHYTADCLSLLGYHAFNRPIYLNRPISAGYNGGPYDFHVRSHCGVVVDNLQAQPIGPLPYRFDSQPTVKYVHVHTRPPQRPRDEHEIRSTDQPQDSATQIYPGVEMSRTLLLTTNYLVDVFWLTSDTPRQYHWLVHALGDPLPTPNQKWEPSDELQKTLFNTPEIVIGPAFRLDAGNQPWVLTTQQNCYKQDPATSILGPDWYDRKIGVRVFMLGEANTTVFHYRPPVAYVPGTPRSYKPDQTPKDLDEVGGVSIAVARHKPTTVFVALHEPFQNGQPRLRSFDRLAQTESAVAARIAGATTDTVLVRFDKRPDEPVTLGAGSESFSFTGYGLIRAGPDRIEVTGRVGALKMKVNGRPQLVVNGQTVNASVDGGFLSWTSS